MDRASRLVEILVDSQDGYAPCAHLLLLFRFVRCADTTFSTEAAADNGHLIRRIGLEGKRGLEHGERVRRNKQQPKYQRDNGWFIRFHALTLRFPSPSLPRPVRWIL